MLKLPKFPGVLIPLLLACLLFGLPTAGQAGSSATRVIAAHKISFLGGLAGGILAHELGHVSLARSMGEEVELDGTTIRYPGARLSDRQSLRLSSAGIQTQWLVSEGAFLYRRKVDMSPRTDSFTAGLICANLAITAAYATVLNNHEDGDLTGVSRVTGASNEMLALAMLAPAVLDGWRLFGDQPPRWADNLSIGLKGGMIAAIWLY